ncbi:uncharacterized protein P174DRAFT_217053 [Aspergillus novofumigatus IBT 16806]|uniref:Uncharacterized protein n=1 Tax=Aspergillus novofumigatus (strain IBT 16806) TaxID=1392255 RepID=A0A2I1C5R0_ASPN1|nr:uncharacterized protein P174DRAFT_217053 [Aspergillus novofumigatus IBT 16806]PKX92946.1 hypothetical protein P174DRAFT_217053 [Aspergillus novofumigatus IBT 16806]
MTHVSEPVDENEPIRILKRIHMGGAPEQPVCDITCGWLQPRQIPNMGDQHTCGHDAGGHSIANSRTYNHRRMTLQSIIWPRCFACVLQLIFWGDMGSQPVINHHGCFLGCACERWPHTTPQASLLLYLSSINLPTLTSTKTLRTGLSGLFWAVPPKGISTTCTFFMPFTGCAG